MFFVPLDAGISIGLLAERKNPSPRFSDDDVSALRNIAPFISALVRQRWKLVGTSGDHQRLRNQHMVTALECFGREVLSDREREITELILRGHSSKSGARELGISPETERVHRKRLYSKLGISSQAELFWLFIQSVRYFNPATHNDPLQVLLSQRE
jgi:DNA-binding CsgD family transcriptional regulator